MPKLPPKPEFPPRDSALLWVGYQRLTGAQMAISGTVLIGLAILNWTTRQHPLVVMHIITIAIGALMIRYGLSLWLRKTPVLAADDRGIVVASFGSMRTLIPWELIDGADVVGKGKNNWLVLLSHHPDAAQQVNPLFAASTARLNRKWGRPGIVYVMAKTMADPAEVVASRIKDILGQTAAHPAPALRA
jgi:hypothetical protein